MCTYLTAKLLTQLDMCSSMFKGMYVNTNL